MKLAGNFRTIVAIPLVSALMTGCGDTKGPVKPKAVLTRSLHRSEEVTDPIVEELKDLVKKSAKFNKAGRRNRAHAQGLIQGASTILGRLNRIKNNGSSSDSFLALLKSGMMKSFCHQLDTFNLSLHNKLTQEIIKGFKLAVGKDKAPEGWAKSILERVPTHGQFLEVLIESLEQIKGGAVLGDPEEFRKAVEDAFPNKPAEEKPVENNIDSYDLA